MRTTKTALARAALAAVIVAAAWGVFDPSFTGEAFRVRQDQVVHALCVYMLTALAIPALPHARPILIGAMVFGLGCLLEYAQGRGWVPGEMQYGDIHADAAGVLLALLPVLLVRSWR